MTPQATISPTATRRRWEIRGQVQGVGFRPFVAREASALKLTGYVSNVGDRVVVEAQGDLAKLEMFNLRLRRGAPPLARIDAFESTGAELVADEQGFTIDTSAPSASPPVNIAADTAVCPDCLREMRDPDNARYGYGLINCTNCGPRYSIIRGVPYDRPRTTMAGFAMCPTCQAEYDDPSDRRYHAQPTACPACGPRVTLADANHQPIAGDPIQTTARFLRGGGILLIKGLGGFHFACDATQALPVARLRRLKQRDAKPFAVMVRDLPAAERLVELSAPARELMASPRCPIVLAPRLSSAGLPDAVAPSNHRLGVMLPYTPIQHLLFDALGDVTLVMTSANVSDEPLVIDNEEAHERLTGMYDAALVHDRPIQRAVDDAVLLDRGEQVALLPVRRARGYVPEPIDLPVTTAAPGLCVGGELKNTVAVVRDGKAILSHHLGDLKHPLALDNFKQAVRDLCALFEVTPQWIAHDLHPAYLSTAHARALAAELRVPLLPVQHHHAHAASLLAEHGRTDPILALTCDGVGHGDDGTSWGGELLITDALRYERAAHLRPLPLPGGDAAAKDTRRCGAALLFQAFGESAVESPAMARLLPDIPERRALAAMLTRGVRCASSNALGRVFDGIAALLGLCEENTHEAQAAMQLESAAAPVPRVVSHAGSPGFRLQPTAYGKADVIDLSPTVRQIVRGVEAGRAVPELAALFHDHVAHALATAAIHAARRHGLRTVGLTGGCFLNARLAQHVAQLLQADGLSVIQHRAVPPGDGGLALGQALVASAQIAGGARCV